MSPFAGMSRPMARNERFRTHRGPEPGPEPRTGDYPTTTSRLDFGSDEEDEQGRRDTLRPPPTTAPMHPNIPLHPIQSMQEAFAESLEEATSGDLSQKPRLRTEDVKTRRERLLDEDKSVGPPKRLWRFRPGQKCHELRKLMAQISFGVYLLINGMANSNAQVLSILQGHINEVDEFLETTMEDVKLATQDLQERLHCLKLPMENMEVFEEMLENRKFRLQIVEGNVKIEHILSRTSTAHTQTIRDISEGVLSARQFAGYLISNENGHWRMDRPDVIDIFEAMKGNTEGWCNAFTTLEANSTILSGVLVKLSTIIVDIDKRAGEVSRRTRYTLEPYSEPDGRPIPRSTEGPKHATPPPSPPMSEVSYEPPPRIQTLYFGTPMSAILDDPESPVYFDVPIKSPKRQQERESNIMGELLPASQYTPPESSRAVPEVLIAEELKVEPEPEPEPETEPEAEAEAQSNDESETRPSVESSGGDDNGLFILQPRTYTPVPPAPIPSPRVTPLPDSPPEEINFTIEALEDDRRPPSEHREVEEPPKVEGPRKGLSIQVIDVGRGRASQQPKLKSPRMAQKEELQPIEHKTSLRDRVSLKIELPHDIRVPPPNAAEFQRPRYPTPNGTPRASPRTYGPPDSAYGSDVDQRPMTGRPNVHSQMDFSPPVFPHLIPSPSSEHQYFRPVQASPHSPLQQRPHTAGTVVNRPGYLHHRNAPSQMGMSMLSHVTVATQGDDGAEGGREGGGGGSTRTVKKKRSKFGWLKKAFSLDEDEKAEFEARKMQQGSNLYYEGKSPRYLDGKRVR